MGFPDYTPTASEFIRHTTEHFADRTMIVFETQSLCYREAEQRSADLALALLRAGHGKGSRIGILLPNGPDWIVTWMAITRIGAIAVPFNTFFQSRELAWMLDHADIESLFMTPRFLTHDYVARLGEAAPSLATRSELPLRLPELPYLRSVHLVGDEDLLERIQIPAWTETPRTMLERAHADPGIDRAFLAAVEARVTPADPMMILYSSGSTADPKGAIHSHGGVIRHSYNLLATRDLVAEDRIWTPMPFFWVGGFVFSLLGTLHRGACILCEEAFEPEKTLRFLEAERATIAMGWPHFGQALANHPDAKTRDLSALRAGNLPEFMPTSIVPIDPELRPNALGMTETCGPHTAVNDGPLPESLRASHGVAVAGVEHKIVDPETGERLPQGVEGEICVRGYNLMQGLYKVERGDTFDRDGFYHTGDGGFFDPNGVLYFKGRLGDMIKTAGANVTPSEVEQVINGFDDVQNAYVVGIPDAERGQLVVAAVVPETGARLDAESLRARIKNELSAYKVPRHLVIEDASALPFTDSGKIDKRKLALLLAARLDPV